MSSEPRADVRRRVADGVIEALAASELTLKHQLRVERAQVDALRHELRRYTNTIVRGQKAAAA